MFVDFWIEIDKFLRLLGQRTWSFNEKENIHFGFE